MAEDDALMPGEDQTRLSRRALASRLASAGLRDEVRESCHYEAGRYVRVHEADDFTLGRVAAGEYLLHANSDTMGRLHQAASRVSAALTGLGIRHRFELPYRSSELIHYLNHQWPQAADA